MKKKVFINYRVGDREHVAATLKEELGRRLGPENVFFASRDVPAGHDFIQVIDNQLRMCGLMLVLIGPRWLDVADESGCRKLDNADDWVRREIALAFRIGVRVIPVFLDGAPTLDSARLPLDIAKLVNCQRLEIRYNYFSHDLELVLDALRPGRRRLAKLKVAGAIVAVLLVAGITLLFTVFRERPGTSPQLVREGTATLRPSSIPCEGIQDKIDLDTGKPGHGDQPKLPCAPPGGQAEIVVEEHEIHTVGSDRFALLPAGVDARADPDVCIRAVGDPANLQGQIPLQKLSAGRQLCVVTDEEKVAAVNIVMVLREPGSGLVLHYTVWLP